MLVTAAYKGQDKARHRSVLQYCICTRHFSFDRPVSIAENPPGSSKDACTGVNKFRIRQAMQVLPHLQLQSSLCEGIGELFLCGLGRQAATVPISVCMSPCQKHHDVCHLLLTNYQMLKPVSMPGRDKLVELSAGSHPQKGCLQGKCSVPGLPFPAAS